MNKQAVLLKLAQVSLAINYVLRNRMQKQADVDNYPKPVSPYNPSPATRWEDERRVNNGLPPRLMPDEGLYTPGVPYRPFGWKEDIDPNNLEYQGSMFRDFIGPLYNKGIYNLDHLLTRPQENRWQKWYNNRKGYIEDQTRMKYNPQGNDSWAVPREAEIEAGRRFDKRYPEPPTPKHIPPEGYMFTPYGTPYRY